MNNPLLEPFNEAPFSKIKNEHFKPAFLQAIEDAKQEVSEQQLIQWKIFQHLQQVVYLASII